MEDRSKTLRNYASKLKNEDTAKRYYGQKLRTGKADNSISLEEKRHKEKLRKQSQKKAGEIEKSKGKKNSAANTAYAAASGVDAFSESVNSKDDGKGESAVAEEVCDMGGYVASGAVSHVTSKIKSNQYSKKIHGRKEAADAGRDAVRERVRKETQKRMIQKQAKTAENGGKIGRKLTDKAEDVLGALAEYIEEFVKDNPVISLIIVLVLILIIVIAGFFNSCSALGYSGGDITVVTTYTAQDEEILAVEEDYKELEEDLQDEIDSIESTYPGYDEYNYYLDEIGHNPYQLAAILTVIYESYTRDEVQAKIQEIFELQYDLTTEEVVEIRQREVEKTGTRWVEDDSYEEGGYEEEYTYTETESYEYYILNVYLVNHTLNAVVEELGLTDDDLARYEVLLYTLGNKKYLFGEDDIYNIPGLREGDSEDHHVPGEYLSDEEFARMLAEAERYLGVDYVWGGYSPDGFDCSGFVSYVINHCGNGWNYGRLTANGLRAVTDYVPSSAAKPGDLIFFQGTYEVSGASHVGIYVGDGWMIHAGNPVHYSNINTSYWQSHFLEFGRLP